MFIGSTRRLSRTYGRITGSKQATKISAVRNAHRDILTPMAYWGWFQRVYAVLAIPWVRLFMAVLAAVSILFGVHLANEGLMPYPDWLDRLVFAIRAAMLSVLIFFSLIVALIVYFAPAILAWRKHKRVRRIIGVFNLFFGWTFFAWLILLAWGLTPDKETEASA